GRLNLSNIAQRNSSQWNENWVLLILRHIEEQTLRKRFALTKPIPSSANAAPRGRQVSIMLCPSDAYNSKPFDGTASSSTMPMGSNWARGNYAANASIGYMWYGDGDADDFSGLGKGGTNSDGYGWGDRYKRGVMGAK